MNTKFLLLLAFCFTLTACGRRNPTNQPTLSAPSVVIEQPTSAPIIVSTNTSEPPTQPPQPTTAPTLEPTLAPTEAPSPTATATLAPQADPLGDELDDMLGQMEATNSADEGEMNNLDVP
jgi:hypothetical protein